MRVIGAVSVGRTDWSIWRPVLDEIESDPELELRLYVTGMHLSPEFGMTIRDILNDGFKVEERVEIFFFCQADLPAVSFRPQGGSQGTNTGRILGKKKVSPFQFQDLLEGTNQTSVLGSPARK